MMAKKKHNPVHKLHHANLYYLVMVISLTLAIFFIVQGVMIHIDGDVYFATSCYLMAVMLGIVARASHTRGKGHYHYHGHL